MVDFLFDFYSGSVIGPTFQFDVPRLKFGAVSYGMSLIYEPRREKTGLRGFRPSPTQTGLYKLRKELEA